VRWRDGRGPRLGAVKVAAVGLALCVIAAAVWLVVRDPRRDAAPGAIPAASTSTPAGTATPPLPSATVLPGPTPVGSTAIPISSGSPAASGGPTSGGASAPGGATSPAAPPIPPDEQAKLAQRLYVAANLPGASPDTTGDVTRLAGDSVQVVVTGTDAVGAIAAAGGQVLASADGRTSGVVPSNGLRSLAADSGVAAIGAPLPVQTGSINQAVGLTNASAWQSAGYGGDGVRVAIVDAGFANLAAEAAAGDLPSGQGVAGNFCGTGSASTLNSTEHGTAVAEVVHQMAPYAQLYLYCVADAVGFATAEQAIEDAGIKLVNSSLAFPGDASSSGSIAPPVGSAAATVNRARAAGILWTQSAGNYATEHWSGSLAGASVQPTQAIDTIHSTGSTLVVLQWEQWAGGPISPVQVCGRKVGSPSFQCFAGDGDTPVAVLGVSSGAWQIGISSASLSVHYDLTYYGSVTSDDATANPAAAASGSIASPAGAPGALAVGAICPAATSAIGQACGAQGDVEQFSSRGPTVDGRAKPEISAYDGMTSHLASWRSGFYGTSASAPTVVGAAALLLQKSPNLTADQLEAALIQNATGGQPNQDGAGNLILGAPQQLVASRYVPITPTRVYDTRSACGYVPEAPFAGTAALGAGEQRTIALPTSGAAAVPAGATSVVVTLTGDCDTGSGTYLAIFGGSWNGSSNLNLDPSTDPTAAATAVVPISNGSVRILNNLGSVRVALDVQGYFVASGGAGYVPLATPVRAYDSRTASMLSPGNSASVSAVSGAPSGAVAAVVNLTVIATSATGFLSATATATSSTSATSNLNFSPNDRANLAIVPLSASGGFVVTSTGSGPVYAIVDVIGYFVPSGGAGFVASAPVREIDTRYGQRAPAADLGAGGSVALNPGIDAAGLPSRVALFVNMTTIGYSTGYMVGYGGSGPPPPISNVNFSPSRDVPNAAIVGSVNGTSTFYSGGADVAFILDAFGYFVP
jgi:hypothetical protein